MPTFDVEIADPSLRRRFFRVPAIDGPHAQARAARRALALERPDLGLTRREFVDVARPWERAATATEVGR